jgi:uncharacterized delta-60 repeat protein
MGVSVFPPASSGGGGGGSSNDFTLSVGVTGNTTYVLDRVYTSGRYTLEFVNSDTTYDIYAIAENGTYAGYTNGAVLEVSANFAEIVVLGAASSETIIFSYEGTLTAPSTAGDVATAGAFLSGVVTSSLPGINDTTVVNGGNFAANVVVSFIDQSDAETLAKNVVRSSSTQLVVTRPDAFSPDDSPYTVKVVNPGIPVPSGSGAYLLVDSVTAGTNPVWQTTGDLPYNIGAATPDITLLATDSEGTDIDYSVFSGTLPAGLTLVEETGVLSGTFSGSASEGDSNSVTFKAIDTGGNFLNKAFNFVANAAPVWTTAAGALEVEPAIEEAYSFQLIASGGSAGGALTYNLQSGSLNTGLSVSTSGEISGTSTDEIDTVATFTIRVTDAAGLSSDREFTTTIISADTYWLSTVGIGGTNFYSPSVAVSSLGDSYTLGYTTADPAVSNAILLVKRDPNGVLQWQRLMDGSESEVGESVTVDSSDNVYVTGYSATQSAGSIDTFIAKYNSSGNLQWQRILGSTDTDRGSSISFDSLGNVYITGYSNGTPGGDNDLTIVKYDSSGTLQWQRILGGTGTNIGRSVSVDSSGNIYVAGYTTSEGEGGNDGLIAKYNSSGTIQWQRVFGGTDAEIFHSVSVDSSGNIYVAGYTTSEGEGGNDLLVLKYDSSGALQWQRILGGTGLDRAHGVSVDSSDNVYALGVTNSEGEGSYDGLIVKYDSSGNLQWQRILGGTGNDWFEGITIDKNDNILVSGRTSTNTSEAHAVFLAKLPSDGSLIGAYRLNGGDFVYRASGLISAESSLTSATSTLTSATSSHTAATGQLASTAANYANSVTGGSAYAEFTNNALMPFAEVGAAYSQTFSVAVQALDVTVSYSFLSGSVPAGMSFDVSSVTVSGSSNEAPGTNSTFTLRGVASNGITVDKEFTIGTVMQPKITGSSIRVINVSPYTHQYYLVESSSQVSVPTSLTNVSLVLVGGGASGTYQSGSSNTQGGIGGSVSYQTGLSISAQTSAATIGAGGSYTFGGSNAGSSTSIYGYSATGGNGTTTSGINGSNSASSVMIPVSTSVFDAGTIASFTGLEDGYLGGSGSGATIGSTPRPAGLGGGGHGIYYDNVGRSGAYRSGGGGGGGGQSGGAGSVGNGGGMGLIVIAVPNQ